MRRRSFLTLLAGAAAAWPRAARAQQQQRMRHIGVLISLEMNDPESQGWAKAFEQRLQSRGWTAGRNVQVDYRWAGGVGESTRIAAAELIAMSPDVIVADGTPTLLAVQRETQSLPIEFVLVPASVAA